MQEIVKHGQSLIDISLQYTGSLESLFAHAAANNMAISDDVNPGDNIEVILPDVQPEVVAYLVKNEKIIAASYNDAEVYNGIQYDFIETPDPYIQPY